MADLIYFHIGLPKAGTTFVQTAMWHNRQLLRKQGVLYPGSDRMDHFHASQVVREVADPVDPGAWDRLVGELAAWDGTGLITHEFFCTATEEQAKAAVAALAPAEVRVVVTARDYVRQFPAVWQEGLKAGTNLPLNHFMRRALRRRPPGPWGWDSQDLPAVMRRWSAAVGADQMHLVTLPPPGAPPEVLWQRWCEVTGLDGSAFELDGRPNESMGAPQAALMRHLKKYLSGPLMDPAVRHRWLRQYFGHEVLVPQRGPRFGLAPRHVEQLRELSLQAVEELGAAGYHVVGSLDDLVPEPSRDDDERPHPDTVSQEELLDVAARAIEQMIRDVRELSIERDRWRRLAQQNERRGPSSPVQAARRGLRRVRAVRQERSR